MFTGAVNVDARSPGAVAKSRNIHGTVTKLGGAGR